MKPSTNHQLANFLLTVGLLVLVSCSFIVLAQEQQRQQENEVTSKQDLTARGKFNLPKLFDFSRFKALFKKSYNSLIEELARQKIFLGRAFKAFVSAVGYKNGKSSSYLSINHLSDQTPDELDKSKINSNILRRRFNGNKNKTISQNESTKKHGRPELPVADLRDIEREFEEMEENKDESPVYKEIVDELKINENTNDRSKRDVSGSNGKRQLFLDKLMRAPEDERKEKSEKYVRRVPSNNPNYEPLELSSESDGDDEIKPQPLSDQMIKVISNLPGAGYLKSVANSLTSTFQEKQQKRDKKPDKVFVDHRDSKCFLNIRDQGKCGSCYAFATIALFEWMFCMDTGRLVSFSEQYMVDCIPYMTQASSGCDGSGLDDSSDFVANFGLELRANYPYRYSHGQCPYEKSQYIESLGYVRLEETGRADVEVDQMAKRIRDSPLLVAMSLGPDFSFYGGGVDENLDCDGEDGHAMLIVGRGREDGKVYWLFRNSYSTAWGEEGYWKVSDEGMKRCILDGSAIEVLGSFDKKGLVNPWYVDEPVKRHNAPFMDFVDLEDE